MIWTDDVRRDANPANREPFRQTKEADQFVVLVMGQLQMTLYISVYIFQCGKKKLNIRKNRHRNGGRRTQAATSTQLKSGCEAQHRCLPCTEIR